MLINMLRPTIMVLLAFVPLGVATAEDMKIDCKLKGGSVVQLTVEACRVEGGMAAIDMVSPALEAMPELADEEAAKDRPPVDPKLAAAQKVVVDLLGQTVRDMTPLNRNPESIDRAARFDGCRLLVGEILHIEYGNLFSVWKDFKISSVIDLQKIDRDNFGILGKISSKGGDLKGAAVSFEERKGDGNISISVLAPRKDAYEKYKTHGASAYWSAPRDNLWIADEYGYVKENRSGNVDKNKVRILLIVGSSDEAEKLKDALEEVHTLCRSQ